MGESTPGQAHIDFIGCIKEHGPFNVVERRIEGQQHHHADGQGLHGDDLTRLLQIYPAMLRALHVDAQGRVVDMRDTRLRMSSQILKAVSLMPSGANMLSRR